MTGRAVLAFILTGALLTGCGSNPDPQEQANNASPPAMQENIAEPDAMPTDAPALNETALNKAGAGDTAIPAALQGRWGQVANDCQPGRADAKGLLVITADTLKFYESSGKVGKVETRTASRLVANFAMMGEGMEWNRRMAFDLSNGGRTMVRNESGAEAPYEPVTYQRCP